MQYGYEKVCGVRNTATCHCNYLLACWRCIKYAKGDVKR